MTAFSLTNATNLFKTNYYKKSENMYNSANILLGRIKKRYDFTGNNRFVSTPLSFSGGVGSYVLPTAGVATYEDALITANKVYATCEIEREAIKASADDKGAFVRATKEVVQKCVESYMRNSSRILFGDGTAALGTSTAANATGSAAAPVIIITSATWNEANWEEKDLVNFNSDTSVFSIDTVAPSTRTVTLARVSGSLDLTGTGGGDIAYMQNSKDHDPQGLKGVCDATSGSLYTVPVQRRWQSTQVAASGSGITTDKMNNVMLEVERKFGKAPKMILTSYTQYQKVLNQLEDHKRYNMEPRAKNLKGKISFQGLEFMSTRGTIGIFADRFCDADRMYFLNDDFIECHHRPDFGWFDDDGTVFLRKASSDAYEARYGGYYENYITPSAHGVITGLSI